MSKLNRRTFTGLVGGVAASAMIGRSVGAQDATPAATEDIFAGVSLQPGVVPTLFGDIELPASVERVVTLTDGALDAAIAVGVLPVGLTQSSNFEAVAVYIEDMVTHDPTYVGGWGEMNIEAIVALEPDIILTDRYEEEASYELLSAIAPTIVTGEIEVSGPDALQQWEYEHLVWGYALGKEAEARETILALRTRAAELQPSLGDKLGQSVVVFRPQAEFPVVMSHHWITGVMLSWSGMTGNELTESTPPPHSGNTVSLERFDLLEADWLFAATRNEEMVQALQDYLENPSFQTLDAVKENQVARVSGDLWSGATGVLAGHAMLDDISKILIDGEYEA